MWAVLGSIPDVEEYYAIFDDYLDFEIKPWDEHGYDEGVLIPERKVALRYLNLAMNIHKSDPALLPTNLLTFMSEYTKPEYQEPDTIANKVKKTARRLKYSDLREEVGAAASITPEQKSSTESAIKNAIVNSPVIQKETGLSAKSLQGFNWGVRKGSTTSDVIEKTDIIPKGPNRYIQTTTRSVFWDVPGEDSLNKDTWDVSQYTSPEDMERIRKQATAAKGKGKRNGGAK